MITINYRDCKHERTFTVKTKRGDINTYCSDCFKWLRPANLEDRVKLRKSKEQKIGRVTSDTEILKGGV